MYVSQSEISSTPDLNELTYAQKVVSTYINFLETTQFYKRVKAECGLDYSANQLKEMTVIRAVDDTEIFEISVTSTSAKDSYEITKAMQVVAPKLITDIKQSAQISVVDPVIYPDAPSGPNVILNTLVGGLLGLFLSIIAAFLWEIIDVKVKDQADLKKKYEIPILGSVPDYNHTNKNVLSILNKIPFIKHYKGITQYEKTISDESKFIINEAFKSLRTNLRFTLRNDSCKKIIINSPLPGDGKSTICANLAISIAQSGASVLLLDCDLRKGKQHKLMNLNNTHGVSDILSGMVNEKESIQKTKFENLSVLTMGSIPPNPTELLGSVQMEELINRLEKLYDYILFDTPPVDVVSDVLSLAKMADGIVLVAREGVTTHPYITAAINKYHFSEANLLGFVLNATSLNQTSKTKSKYHYYRNYSRKNG